MNNTCKNCQGHGLVGNGDKPWLRQGQLSTCKVCGGSGKIVESIPEQKSKETYGVPTGTKDL